MANPSFNYKTDITRYRYYYQRINLIGKKPVTQVSAALLFTIGAIIFFGVVAIKPTLETISQLNQKIAEQKKVLDQAEKKVAALSTAQQQYDSVVEYLPVLDEAIPAEYAAKQLLLDLESVAAQNGLPVQSLKISDLEFPVPEGNDDEIRELNFTLTLEAPYPQAKAMLIQLEHLPRLVTLKSLAMTTNENRQRSAESDPNSVQISAQYQAFYKTDPSESP
jgi:Tfp pilus assembly protein PilO